MPQAFPKPRGMSIYPCYTMSIDSTVAAWHTQFPSARPERMTVSYDDGCPSPIEIYNYSDTFAVYKAVPARMNASAPSRAMWQHFATMTELIHIPTTYHERGHKTCNEFLIVKANDILSNMQQALGIEISSESEEDTSQDMES